MDNPYAERRSVQLDGYKVRYWFYDADKQRKPLVVMFHGFRGDHHGMQLIAAELREKYHVVVPDLPGFGRSEPFPEQTHSIPSYVRFATDFVRALTDDAVHPGCRAGIVVVGHSFGSIIASHFAAAHPEMVERLVLINPISEPPLHGRHTGLTRLTEAYYNLGRRLPRAIGTKLLSSQAVIKFMTDTMIKGDNPEVKRYALRQHQSYFNTFADRDVLQQAYQASISRTVAEVAMKLTMPTLLVVGELDEMGSVASQTTMASWIRSHRLEVIPGVGHLIHYEAPVHTAELIEDFLSSPAPEPLEGHDELPVADLTESTPDQLTGVHPVVRPDQLAREQAAHEQWRNRQR